MCILYCIFSLLTNPHLTQLAEKNHSHCTVKDYESYLSERIMKVTYRKGLWKILIGKDYESYLSSKIMKVTYRQGLWKLLIDKDYESYLSSRIMKVTYRQGLWKLLIAKDYLRCVVKDYVSYQRWARAFFFFIRNRYWHYLKIPFTLSRYFRTHNSLSRFSLPTCPF